MADAIGESDEPALVGGRGRLLSRRSTRSKGKGRSRNGGTFLAEISVPVALLAGVQYMKSRGSRSGTKRRKTRRNYKNKSQKRRRR